MTRKRRRHVLLVVQASAVGGMERVCLDLAATLASHVDVQVVLPARPDFDELEQRFSLYGVPAWRVESTWDAGRRAQMRGLARLALRLARDRPSVIHLHTGSEYGGSALAALAWLRGVPLVVTEHGLSAPGRSRKERLARSVLHRTARVFVAVSPWNAERSLHRTSRAEKQAVVVNGVGAPTADAEESQAEYRDAVRLALGLRENVPVIGAVARFIPEKRVDALIEASAGLVGAGAANLLLVGDGSCRAELEGLVDSLGIREGVRFTGFQSKVDHYLAAMDIFVLAQAEGTMSMSVLEAMQAGCVAVIGYGGSDEPVVDRATGIRVPGGRMDELRAALEELVADESLRRRLAASGKQQVSERFSAARMANEYLAIYRSAVRGEPVPRHLRP